MRKLLFLLTLSLLPLLASAEDVEIDGIYYHLYSSGDKNNATVMGNPNKYSGEVVIPESITYNDVTYSVTSIGYCAFSSCSGLTSVTIPNSVTSIGGLAFNGCSGLTSVTIPNSVTSIGEAAFADCSGLTSVTIPNSVTSIGIGAFQDCSGLTSITIPNSVTSIGGYAFNGCSGLTSVTIPNSVTSIGESAFEGCSGLTSVTIPNSVTSINYGTFRYCSGLTSVVIPNSVTSIGYEAFAVCSRLTSVVIPNSVTSIGEAAFYGCSGLTSVTIPNSVTSIGGLAFNGCSGLTSVTIPNSVTSIGYEAFVGCSGLKTVKFNCETIGSWFSGLNITEIIIGNEVTTIGGGAFSGCSSLPSVTIPNSVTSIGGYAFYGCSGLTSVTIPNSVTSIGEYAFSGCSSLISIDIPNSVTSIGVFAFCGCSGSTSVSIPNSVTSIGSSAFSGCSSLTSVDIPNSVTSIGSSAFSGCSSLTSVTIPNSVVSIGNHAFEDCNSLNAVNISDLEAWCKIAFGYYTSSPLEIAHHLYLNGEEVKDLIIPESITSLGLSAFEGCTGLTSVTIPNSVTSIGGWAFNGCSGLTSVTIPNSVTSIGTRAFSFCNGLTSVTIPNSVTSIGDYAFYDCNSLNAVNITDLEAWCKISFGSNTSNPLEKAQHLYLNGEEIKDLIIPNTITFIGNSVFSGCSYLASVTIPNSVTSIGNNAFRGCWRELSSVTIPNSVTSIGNSAFQSCGNLTSVSIPNSVTSIGESAFKECGLTSVIIPNSVLSIGKNAFDHCEKLTSVIIGKSVTSIGDEAFYWNIGLSEVYCLATDVPKSGKDVFGSDPYGEHENVRFRTLYVSTGCKEKYASVYPWCYFKEIIEIDPDNWDPNKLPTPDINTFKATDITQTSFVARWDAVPNATKYDINVKLASDEEYPNSGLATSQTYYKITGLTPNASYQFQVRARNDDRTQTSNWSTSIPTAVTTLEAGTGSAGISIYGITGFDGTDPLVVGNTYYYKVYVVNNSSSDWIGAFYLKDGDTVLHRWHKVSLPKDGKSVQPLEFDYKPNSIGPKILTLYCQTSVSEGGFSVNAGDGDNPITVEVITDPSVYDGLSLKSAIVCPESLELGQKGTISVEVQNTGKKDWYGTLYLTDDHVSIGSVENLYAGESKTITKTEWIPGYADVHSIAVYYESKNSTDLQLVSPSDFENPIKVEVKDINPGIIPDNVYIHHITEDVVPSAVPYGADVLYHFRITDEDNKPVSRAVAQFDVEVTSKSGDTRNYTFTSDPSGSNGLLFLALRTAEESAIIQDGESAVIKCTGIFGPNLVLYGKELTILNKEELEPIHLSVKEKALFSEIKEFELTLDVGASAKLSAGEKALITDPSSEDKELASMKAGISLPVVYSLKKDDYGKISKIGIESDAKGTLSAGVNFGEWLSFDTEGYIGLKSKNTFSADDKRAIWLSIANGCEAILFHTNWISLNCARAFCSWFHKKQIEVEPSDSWFVGYSVGASTKLSDGFPDVQSKLIKNLSLPKSFNIGMFDVSPKATVKWEPDKYKTIDSKLDTDSKATVYGESRSLKLSVGNLATSRILTTLYAGKSYWDGVDAAKYFTHFGTDLMSLTSWKTKTKGAFTIKEEEWYSDSKKQDLYSLSNTFDITTSLEVGLKDVPVLGKWLKNEGLDANLTHTCTLSSKLESKGDFAQYLQDVSSVLHGYKVGKIFPVLTGQSIIGAPRTHFEAFDEDIIGTIRQLPINNRDAYSLKESLKLEQKVKSELGASVSIPFQPCEYLKWNIDARLAFACESYPSESYFSVKDNQFVPVVLQPSTSIKEEIEGLVDRISVRLNKSFDDNDRKDLDDEYRDLNRAQVWAGSVVPEPHTFSYEDLHFELQTNNYVRARAARLHTRLASTVQSNICKMDFTLNTETPCFDSDVTAQFMHFYPAGDLLGITDQNDTIFVVSEVCDLKAVQGTESLKTTQYGQIKLDTTIGLDDLTPFGLSENTPLNVYYSEEGSEIWHYVGPAGTTIMTDKLGTYMMGTSLNNDDIAPEIVVDLDEQAGILNIKVNENIGLRHQSLSILLNGAFKKYNVVNESCFEVILSEEEMQYRINLDVTINDLAGNQGRLSQIFQLDKPEKIDANNLPDTDVSKIRNTIYVEPVSAVSGGSLILSVKMKNKVDAEGFQFDLELPEGVTVAKNADGSTEAYLSSERTTANKTDYFDSSFLENGVLQVKAGSTNGSAIDGNDGEVAIIKLDVASDVSEGTYPIVLRNIVISDTNSESHKVDHVKSTLTVILGESIKIGSNGKTTYTGDKGLDFSGTDEVKAFIATGFDKAEGTIWMTRVKDVPAGVPVLIKGTANETYNIPVTDGGTSYYKNMFKGNISGETISIGKTSEDGKYDNYYLSKGQFVSVNGSANIGNNKCYLQLPAEFAPALTGEGVEVKIAASGKSSFAAPYDLDFTDQGDDLKAFTATGFDKSTSTIWLTRVKKVQKGEGLLLKGTGGETYTIPSTGVQSSYVNMIVGNISGETLEIGETAEDGTLTNYYLSGGTYKSVTVSANIGNNKSYLQLPTSMLAGARSEEASDKQSEYSFTELETESMPLILAETTGIESMENGQSILDKASDEWYSLSGQRIVKPTKKGLYIHNGKKVVIK